MKIAFLDRKFPRKLKKGCFDKQKTLILTKKVHFEMKIGRTVTQNRYRNYEMFSIFDSK